uniref:Uncharacterized protein PFB0145c-like n=1 Tax=Diabrotica virgifera virgifera TaxID=50390 RepID=A0A6P7G4V2_DIAVI
MKKALKKKLSGTKSLIRNALSKTSTSSYESVSQTIVNQKDYMEQEVLLKNELEALKDQISNLKGAVQVLQNESEQKDISIANLAREKERISSDLLKTRRSNVSLAKQLDDERKFYFKEKELYCQEMNECKKLRALFSSSSAAQSEKTIDEYRRELAKVKQNLNQTLQANYNLSIKFLRMKNTKTCLKTELRTLRLEYEKLVNDYKSRIESLTVELNDLVNDKLNTAISCSSKKYLQVVKQNGCLVYENLCLQLEVDNLNFKLEKVKLSQTKYSTNEHLRYVKHPTRSQDQSCLRNNSDEAPEKLEREPQPCSSKTNDSDVIKIYERNKSSVIPTIELVKEQKSKIPEKKKRKKKELLQNEPTSTKSENARGVDHTIIEDNYKMKITNNLSRIALFQVSNTTSVTSGMSNYISSSNLKRTQSSPNILENLDFQKKS